MAYEGCARCRELEGIINHLRDRLEMRGISDLWEPDVQTIEIQRLRTRVLELERGREELLTERDQQGTVP